MPQSQDELDRMYMRQAVDCAMEGTQRMEFPFGACLVHNDRVIAIASNRCLSSKDPTMHAEMIAIREACGTLDRASLQQATLYATTEPCVMCMGAIHWAGIPRIVYGLTIEDSMVLGFKEIQLSARTIAAHAAYEMTLKGGC